MIKKKTKTANVECDGGCWICFQDNSLNSSDAIIAAEIYHNERSVSKPPPPISDTNLPIEQWRGNEYSPIKSK